MKRLKLMFLLVLAGLAMTAGSAAGAEEEDEWVQDFVIGLGIVGMHAFDRGDDLRDAAFTLDIGVAGMNQVYFEWFFHDRVGIGLRSVVLGVTEKATLSDSSGTESQTTSLRVWNHFLTLTVLPLIAESGYWRAGFLAGAGVSDYTLEQKAADGTKSKFSTDGPAALAQAYIDWGGNGFGARFGIGVLKTQLKDVKLKEAPDMPLTADATGSHAFLDLRWVF